MKLACALLIAFTLAGGAASTLKLGADVRTPIAMPPPDCPDDPWCDDDELTRKVNEYEGQHVAEVGDSSQGGSEDVYKKGSFDLAWSWGSTNL
jgi:hypothetical protein